MSTPDREPETKEILIPQSPPRVQKMTAEDLAPDGGWGWMVAAGTVVVNLVSLSQGASFGLLYGDLLQDSDSGGSALTSINLLFMVALCFSGLICKELMKTYNNKYIGTFGAVLYATANTITCVAPNVFYVALAFLVQGLGVGLMMTICTITFNKYFFKRRTKVMGASQVIIGLGPIIYPILIEKLIAAYGYRATMALIGALSFNAVISMYVMDPVEQHYKVPKSLLMRKNEEENDEEIISNSLCNVEKYDAIKTRSIYVIESGQKNRSVQNLCAETDHEKLSIEDSKIPRLSHGRSTSDLDFESGFRSRPGKGTSLDILANRLSMTAATSVRSLGGVVAFVGQIPEVEVKTVQEKKKPMLEVIADFFELSLLQDWVYLNMCIGSSTSLTVDLLFLGFLPLILADEGYSTAEVALTLTVGAIVELVSKIIFTIFSVFFVVSSRDIFFWTTVALCIGKTAFLYCNTLMSKIIVNALTSFVRSWYMVAQTLMFAEYFSIDKFPAATAMYTLILGLNSVILLPLIGLLKDFTQSYLITQYALLAGSLFCVVSWMIEYLLVGRRTTARNR